MEHIEGINLEELTIQTAKELLDEKKKSVAGLVRVILNRIHTLDDEIKKLEKDIVTKRKNLEQTQLKLEKIRNGDWSLLSEQAIKKTDSIKPDQSESKEV